MADHSRFFSSDNDAGIQQAEAGGRSSLNFNPKYPVTVMGPTYDGKVTIVRLLPCWDNTVTPYEEIPYRSGARYSPWYRSYPIMKSVGSSSKVTIYLNDPQVNRSWDKNTNPLVILRREISNAVDYAQKSNGSFPDQRRLYHGGTVCPHYWGGLIKGGHDKGAAIPSPTSVVVCYALVYQQGKKTLMDGPPIGLREGDNNVLFEFSGTFWQDVVLKKMSVLKPGYQGDTNNLEEAYENGDPVGLANGRFLHIFKIGCDPRQATAAQDQLSIYSNSGKQGGSQQAIGYDGFFTRTAPGYPQENGMPANLIWPPPHDVIATTIRDRYVPIDDVVSVLSPIDQAKAVYALFPPEVLMYAWEKFPQFITDDLRKLAHDQLAVNVTTVQQPMAPAPMPATSWTAPAPTGAPAPAAQANWLPAAPQQPMTPGYPSPYMAAPTQSPPVQAPPVQTQPAAPYQAAQPGSVPISGFNTGVPAAPPASGPWPAAAPAAVDPGAAHLQSPTGDFAPPAATTHTIPVNTSPLPTPTISAPSNIDMLKQMGG